MSRQRFKAGMLEYSTNEYRNIMAKRLLIEVKCEKGFKLSQTYYILGIKKKPEKC